MLFIEEHYTQITSSCISRTIVVIGLLIIGQLSNMSSSAVKPSSNKVVEQCLRILQSKSNEGTQKWIADNKLKSMTLRNVKAVEVISLSNYLLEKMLANKQESPSQLLHLLADYHKAKTDKSFEFAHLVKHFSEWDYEFEFIYGVALNEKIGHVERYLRLREVLRAEWNKAKKEMLSGISKELEEWAVIAKIVFREKEEEDVIDLFTTVVKSHYVQVKKSQSEKINGAEFLKISQIMANAKGFGAKESPSSPDRKREKSATGRGPENMSRVFDETLLNGLSTQDKQLIRVLSYKDKNIAHMLQQKHTKMVHLIGEQVSLLRRDINHEKERYVQVVQQKNRLLRLVQRIKESSLKYIIEHSEANEFELLQLLDGYNKKNNPKATDVAKTTAVINNRRLIDIIEREQLQKD